MLAMNKERANGGASKTQRMLAVIGARHHMIEASAAYTEYGGPKPYEIRDGIAVVDIAGPLASDPDWWDRDYGSIGRDVKAAAADPTVRGIILNINSPGGETTRSFETAALIEQAGKKKPLWAVADSSAYSAGYLLASAASKIYCSPTTGGVGSIGVYTVHFDYSGYLAEAGIKPTIISAGDGKTGGNPYEPLSPEAEKTLRAEIDRLYGEFVAWVSRRRSMPVGQVRRLGSALFHGSDAAIRSGLADRAGSLKNAIDDMLAETGPLAGHVPATASVAQPQQFRQQQMDASLLAAADRMRNADVVPNTSGGLGPDSALQRVFERMYREVD